MKHLLPYLALFSFLMIRAQSVNSLQHDCQVSYDQVHSYQTRSQACANPNLEYYLKRPPITTSFIVTEDRMETIQLVLKDEYDFTDIEIVFGQFFNIAGVGWQYTTYQMFDDGTHGDISAGDKIFTSDEILIQHEETNTYTPILSTLDVIYNDSGNQVHNDIFTPDYTSINTSFLNTIEIPNIHRFNNDDYLFSENFIFVNKYENWGELLCNQIGGVLDPSYVISKSLLYDYWGEEVINSQMDKNLYMQVDFIQPHGQFLIGQDIALHVNSLSGVESHEILHLWIPRINGYLGFGEETLYNNTNHHPNIFKNTSGFLYSSWSRVNGIYCENSINNLQEDDQGTFVYLDYTSNYELCNGEIDQSKDKQIFNDFEQYLMGLITIDEVDLPLTYLNNIYAVEEVIDPQTNFLVGERRYYESFIEIDREQLEQAKSDMLDDAGDAPFLDAAEPNNFFLTFTGNKSTLSDNEIKFLSILSQDLTTTEDRLQETNVNTYHQNTEGRSTITANIPNPTLYTGDIFTEEHITILEGEEYNGWTVNGTYERILDSEQYNDSIVTTYLTVEEALSINDLKPIGVKLYPNPASSTIFIDTESLKSYKLYNTLGQVVIEGEKNQVNVSNLESGMYFMQVLGLSQRGMQTIKVIIK
ncbi:T9SS C-terminal target domain-containing protein [Dokdonia sinensis]|uniref:T9SS C-terminal target domain-containing protein n=1 Tax=Dokdonia sinensis TaxID=2479847 RepID=A0A3M0GGF6_9FLAO|nr:T9SS type A sorting domain-containing protein [Dokdonia sinensis]RMB63368.1 T9SS C-terminal target domain-containing protein [Dokdonia sinensis]